MRKIKLYIAASLNGKITGKDGSVEWLEKFSKPETGDYGYQEFLNSIDTTLQGRKTYQQIIDWGIEFPYQKTKNYVLTRQKNLKDTEYVEFIRENHIERIKKIKEAPGSDIWLIGGGTINALLLEAGLIDKMQVFLMPIILSEGIDLFEGLQTQTGLFLKNTKKYSSGVIELTYEKE